MSRSSVLPVVLGGLLCVPAAVLAGQVPTLGELALKEQARRKTAESASKVLTNESLPRGAAPAPKSGAEAAKDAAPGSQQDPQKAGEPGTPDAPGKPAAPAAEEKNETWWRERITKVRDELRRNETYVQAIQTRINSLTNDFATTDDPYQRAQVAEDRVRAILELDRLKAENDENRKKILGIEEEARRAGVPPGWLR